MNEVCIPRSGIQDSNLEGIEHKRSTFAVKLTYRDQETDLVDVQTGDKWAQYDGQNNGWRDGEKQVTGQVSQRHFFQNASFALHKSIVKSHLQCWIFRFANSRFHAMKSAI